MNIQLKNKKIYIFIDLNQTKRIFETIYIIKKERICQSLFACDFAVRVQCICVRMCYSCVTYTCLCHLMYTHVCKHTMDNSLELIKIKIGVKEKPLIFFKHLIKKKIR